MKSFYHSAFLTEQRSVSDRDSSMINDLISLLYIFVPFPLVQRDWMNLKRENITWYKTSFVCILLINQGHSDCDDKQGRLVTLVIVRNVIPTNGWSYVPINGLSWFKIKSGGLSEWMTRSPIELFWTAAKTGFYQSQNKRKLAAANIFKRLPPDGALVVPPGSVASLSPVRCKWIKSNYMIYIYPD